MNMKRWLRWRWLRLQERFGAPPAHLRKHEFAIAFGRGASPVSLTVGPPAITWRSCRPYPALFVADPFMVPDGETWHLFFEILDWRQHKGVLGCAHSNDLTRWTYDGVVLEEAYHLSYPHVFHHDGSWYMTPEGLGSSGVRLYRASRFPMEWEPVGMLLEGVHADPTLFYDGDTWYMFTCTRPDHHDELRLHWSETLMGLWTEHPASPIVTADAQRARPAGRVVRIGGTWHRFAQDCGAAYGTAVRAFRIEALSKESYREVEVPESPVLRAAGSGWNGRGMHHIDAHEQPDGSWVACVDGWRRIVE